MGDRDYTFAVRVCRGVALGIAAWLSMGGTGAAQPGGSERFDLDHDGLPEEIRIEREGALAVVSGQTGKIAAWKPLMAGAQRGELQIATGPAVGGRVVILALAHADAGGPDSGRGEGLAVE